MTDLDGVKEDIREIKGTVGDIFKILNGNGQEGLVTKVALHEQRFKSIPGPNALRLYALTGGGAVTAIMAIVFAVYKAIGPGG